MSRVSLSGVASDMGTVAETLTADATLERFLSCVGEHMKFESFIASEHLTTLLATELLNVGVGALMPAEVGTVRESPLADHARIRLRLAVGCLVRQKLALASEDLAALAAVLFPF